MADNSTSKGHLLARSSLRLFAALGIAPTSDPATLRAAFAAAARRHHPDKGGDAAAFAEASAACVGAAAKTADRATRVRNAGIDVTTEGRGPGQANRPVLLPKACVSTPIFWAMSTKRLQSGTLWLTSRATSRN